MPRSPPSSPKRLASTLVDVHMGLVPIPSADGEGKFEAVAARQNFRRRRDRSDLSAASRPSWLLTVAHADLTAASA